MNKKRSKKDIVHDIKEVIRTEIIPVLEHDGGSIDFVKFEDGVVEVTLLGACRHCAFATMTLKNMVEVIIKDHIPEVIEVVNNISGKK